MGLFYPQKGKVKHGIIEFWLIIDPYEGYLPCIIFCMCHDNMKGQLLAKSIS